MCTTINIFKAKVLKNDGRKVTNIASEALPFIANVTELKVN